MTIQRPLLMELQRPQESVDAPITPDGDDLEISGDMLRRSQVMLTKPGKGAPVAPAFSALAIPDDDAPLFAVLRIKPDPKS